MSLDYRDDVIVFFNLVEATLRQIIKVLRILRNEHVFSNSSKCEFFVLRLRILAALLGPNDWKIEARSLMSFNGP